MGKIDFIGETRRASVENARDVINKITNNDKNVLYKIDEYCTNYALDRDEVINRILNGDLITASIFAINPTKQNIAEKLQANYIKSINGVKNFKKLPTSFKNGLFIYNGSIVSQKELPVSYKDLKTIDFYWEYKDYKIYAGCKYTNNGGGAQDNQYADLKAQLKEAANLSNNKVKFIAICDGAYYQKPDRVDKDLTSEQSMNFHYKTSNSCALTTDEIEDYLQHLTD